jgi:hypothetical protein
MPSGVSGSLLTTAFIARHVKAHGSSGGIEQAAHSVARWWAEADRRCGPAASIRTIVDLVGTPLASMLGFTLLDPRRLSDAMWAATLVGDGMRLPILVISWGAPPESACPAGQRLALAAGADWWLALNGPIVRIVDSRRHAPTRHLDISLSSAADDDSTAWLLLWLLRGLPPSDDPHHDLASMVAASDREAHAVCSALRTGVREALEHLLNGLIPPRRRSDPELVRACEIAARRHEKCTAAHRGVENSEGEDPLGALASDERRERTRHHVPGDLVRCVERARLLSAIRSGSLEAQHRTVPRSPGHDVVPQYRIEFEKRFVDGA